MDFLRSATALHRGGGRARKLGARERPYPTGSVKLARSTVSPRVTVRIRSYVGQTRRAACQSMVLESGEAGWEYGD